jgi:hypothetical protein
MGIFRGPPPTSHRFDNALPWPGALAHTLHFCWIHVAYKIGPRTILDCPGDGTAHAAGGAAGYRPIGTGMESTQVTCHSPRTDFALQKNVRKIIDELWEHQTSNSCRKTNIF